MAEDKGLVPNRRAVDTPVGPREMLGPYDIDFERQERIEALLGERDKILEDQDGSAARLATLHMLNLIFVEPFTADEFKKLGAVAGGGVASGFFRRIRDEFGGGGGPSRGAGEPGGTPREICAALQAHYKAGDPLAWFRMPFRHLLPMVDEMSRHKAQAMLREIGVARLAQADPKNSAVRGALTDLECQAGREQEPIPISQSLVQVRAMFRGMEEV